MCWRLLVVGGLAFQAPVTAFDGVWDTVISCPNTEGALGFSFRFDSVVKNGGLHGEKGAKGKAGFLELNGTIGADGVSRLLANGLVGAPQYAMGHIEGGTPYAYRAEATFTGDRGTGKRVEGRACDFTFRRTGTGQPK